MKKIILALTLVIAYSTAFTQPPKIKSFFKNLEDGNEYAVVKVNKEMFELLGAMDTEIDGQSIEELVKGLEEITVLIKEGGSEKDYNKFQSLIKSSGLKSYMSFKDVDNDVQLYSSGTTEDGKLDGVVLSVNEGDQTIFVNVNGYVDIKALGKLTKDMNINGLDRLKDLEHEKE